MDPQERLTTGCSGRRCAPPLNRSRWASALRVFWKRNPHSDHIAVTKSIGILALTVVTALLTAVNFLITLVKP